MDALALDIDPFIIVFIHREGLFVQLVVLEILIILVHIACICNQFDPGEDVLVCLALRLL